MADLGVLDVRLHGQSIGTLTRIGRDQIVFGFDRAYIDDRQRPTLSLSFRDPFGGLITDIEPTRMWTHPFFSNLLPEGPLREYLARAAGVDPRAEFALLSALGEDLPGAVTVVPLAQAWKETGGGAGEIGRSGSKRDTPDAAGSPLLRSPAPLRFSVAGVQLKLSAAMTAGRLTIPTHGVGGSWIVKLPSESFPGLPEQEHAMMRLAAAVGIDVPETRLIPVESIRNLPRGFRAGSGSAFAIRRFDREDGGTRVHTEDFAQVLGAYPEQKYIRAGYDDIAEVIGREVGTNGVVEFVGRLVFCTLIGNGDAHLKNWSVIYRDRRNPELTPAYDMVSTIAYADDDTMALEWIGGLRRFSDLSEDLLARLASAARLPQQLFVTAAREMVERFMSVWARETRRLGISAETRTAIEKNLKRLPLTGARPASPR